MRIVVGLWSRWWRFAGLLAAAFAAGGLGAQERIFADGLEDLPATVHAASCSADDVETALAQAADGQLVQIPAGDCDWGTRKLARAAGIVLRGAGVQATIIRRSVAVTVAQDYLLSFDCANGKTIEISDLAFIGNDALQTEAQRLVDLDNGVLLKNGCRDFRIHRTEFREFSHAGLAIRGNYSRGVVYQSAFHSNFKCQPVPTSCLGYGVVVTGTSGAQAPPLALGSEEAVFVEDSIFRDNRHGIASNYGSRYVFRHNVVLSTPRTRNFGLIDAHGRGDYPPGSRSWEIYANQIGSDPPTEIVSGISIRGGDGVIFDNTISDRVVRIAHFSIETGCPVPGPPLPDQIREAYVWNNAWSGPPPGYPTGPIGNSCPAMIREGQEYFLAPRPGYAPYTYPHPLR